jgi:hypothetical protein
VDSDSLIIAIEPEAAALDTLNLSDPSLIDANVSDSPRESVDEGDVVMVVDAGQCYPHTPL